MPAARKFVCRAWRVAVVHFEVLVMQMMEIVSSAHLRPPANFGDGIPIFLRPSFFALATAGKAAPPKKGDALISRVKNACVASFSYQQATSSN